MEKNEMTEKSEMNETIENKAKENVVIDDFDFSLIADFFKRVDRQGPGGEWETRLATSLIPDFKRKIRIADMGCGKGSQTFVLADEYDAEIDAVDLLPEMMEGIRKKIQATGLEDCVHPVQASMDELPFRKESYDLVWAEGSIFIIGYEKGLSYWREFLKPGGFIAVTECSWLGNKRPENMGWIQDNLPEIDSIEQKIHQMAEAGYEPYAHFILPETCWTENYYAPMKPAMEAFLKDHPGDPKAQVFINRLKEEIAYYEENKDCFGYVFYIGRKV